MIFRAFESLKILTRILQEDRFSAFRERKTQIEKDVFRTDRTHPFFAGDNNKNVTLLQDILMTYVMYNFDLGYVQVNILDHFTERGWFECRKFYIIFERLLMARLQILITRWYYFSGHVRFVGANIVRHAKWSRCILVLCWLHGSRVWKFRLRSRRYQTTGIEPQKIAVKVLLFICSSTFLILSYFSESKFYLYYLQLTLLIELLKTLDPEFYSYLDAKDSSNLFFCFRWLLIWFKREFAFTEVMGLWEVLWTDLPCQNFHLVG